MKLIIKWEATGPSYLVKQISAAFRILRKGSYGARE